MLGKWCSVLLCFMGGGVTVYEDEPGRDVLTIEDLDDFDARLESSQKKLYLFTVHTVHIVTNLLKLHVYKMTGIHNLLSQTVKQEFDVSGLSGLVLRIKPT
jgi:hypothetical protein